MSNTKSILSKRQILAVIIAVPMMVVLAYVTRIYELKDSDLIIICAVFVTASTASFLFRRNR